MERGKVLGIAEFEDPSDRASQTAASQGRGAAEGQGQGATCQFLCMESNEVHEVSAAVSKRYTSATVTPAAFPQTNYHHL